MNYTITVFRRWFRVLAGVAEHVRNLIPHMPGGSRELPAPYTDNITFHLLNVQAYTTSRLGLIPQNRVHSVDIV